jgi:uncharacterized membrane protein YccC
MKAAGVAGRIVREATRLDLAGFQWRFGLRCAAGAAIPLLLSLAFDHALLAAAAAVGAFNAGFASRQGVYRTRAAAMLTTSAAMALAAFAATLAAGNVIAGIALAAVCGLAAGVLASLGPTATVVGLQALIALAIFSQFHIAPFDGAILAGSVFAGGALQTLLLVVVWPLAGFSAERNALAAAFRALAAFARDFPRAKLAPPSSQSFATLSETLADPQPFARRSELATFETLLVEAERIRASLAALASDRFIFDRAGDGEAERAVAALGAAVAPVLERIAEALARGRAPDDWDDSWESLDARAERVERLVPARGVEDARALLGRLRAAWRAAESPAGEPAESALPFDSPSLPTRIGLALETLRANFSPASAYAQHGLRLAVTLGLATFLAHALPLQRGYWVSLTAVLVLRPDFATTYTRGVARLIGTLAGSIVASLVVALLHPSAQSHVVLTLLFAFVAYTVFNVNYALFTTAVTGYVVFLLAFGGLPEYTALLDRIEATLLGGTLALSAYAFWPTWERDIVPVRLADLIEAQRTYCALVLGAFIVPSERDARRLHAAQLSTWRARSNAEASVDRMLNEPVAPTALTVRAALGLLAASRRFGLATLTLASRLPPADAPPHEELRALADALDRSLAAIATALRERRPPALPPLRDLQLAFAERVADAADPRARVLVSETDLMTDSANSMADLLARLYTAEPGAPVSPARRGRSVK